jgi:NTP pyrophosphatase (non-canonical NTP hydrolase)
VSTHQFTTRDLYDPLTFVELRLGNEVRQREWDPNGKITLYYRALELAGEAGEAMNVVKKLFREELGLRGSRANLDDLAEELADVIICADLLAMDMRIDLGEAVRKKFNKTSSDLGLAEKLTYLGRGR